MTWILAAVVLAWLGWGPWVLVAVAALLCVPRARWWVLDRVHLDRRRTATGLGALAVVAAALVVVPDGLVPIPPGPGVLATPAYVGRPADPHPVAAAEVPQHPHLSRDGASWPGPLGDQPEVETAWYGFEECATPVFDSRDRLVTVCEGLGGPGLHVVDPDSMRKRHSLAVPERPDGAAADERCGRGPLYLDSADRAVLATADRRVLRVATATGKGSDGPVVEETWDLAPYVPPTDCVVALLPDWSGRVWWGSREGLVGAIVPETSTVAVLDLGETIRASFATDPAGGVYVVTDEALHRLAAAGDGTLQATWRTPYGRGGATAPTLLDGDLLALADNAGPRMQVVFVERSTGREVCRQPVFEEGESATGVSLVPLGSGVVVQNTHGYSSRWSTALGFASSPGIARVDVRDGACALAWTSEAVAPSSSATASRANGLVYAATKRPTWTGVSAWYVTALDARTGRAMWSVRTGTGGLMNGHGAGVALAPDGTLWLPTLGGLVRVRDRVRG